jgi:hypothetical protein
MKISNFIDILNNKWVTPIVTIITGIYGMVFTIYLNKMDIQEKKLNQIETNVNTKIREKEFINNLRLTLYEEVKQSMKTNDTNQQKITLLLIDELLKEDIEFRDKLITLVLSHNNSPSLVKHQKDFMDFSETESMKTNSWNINVYWLEDISSESRPRAEKIVKIIQEKYPNINVRLKKLSKLVNSKKGYRISQNMIRAEKDEMFLATDIMKLINQTNVLEKEKLILVKSNVKTKLIFSIFVRNM